MESKTTIQIQETIQVHRNGANGFLNLNGEELSIHFGNLS